jgi:UPF0716 protein FxsA
MLARLILLLGLLSIVDLSLLILLGQRLGLWPTLGFIFLTGVAGTLLAKSQGLRVIRRIQEELVARRVPTYGLLDGLLILVGGALLLAPGILTDVAGLALMFPFVRNRVKRRIREAIERGIRSGRWHVVRMGPGPGEDPPDSGTGWRRIR